MLLKRVFCNFFYSIKFYDRINKMIFTEQFFKKDLFEKLLFFIREKQAKLKCAF